MEAEGSVPPEAFGASDRSNHWDKPLTPHQIGAGMVSTLATALRSQISLFQGSITS